MQQKWKCVFLAGAVLLSGALNCGATAAEAKKPVKQNAESTQEKVTRLIVKPRSGSGAKLNQALAAGDASGLSLTAQADLSVVRPMSGGAHVLTLDEAVPLDEAKEIAARLRRDGSVEYAEPDRLITSFTVVPNDPLYNGVDGKQWHYFIPSGANKGGANLPNAWHDGYGAGTVVAVLDTGHVIHEDLETSTVITGYDFASHTGNGDGDGWDSDPTDPGDGVAANECGYSHAVKKDSWHGLHVTGTIAATMNNSKGGTGIAPAAKIAPVRVLGKCGGYTSDVADAMRWAAGIDVFGVPKNMNPAHVLNLSLGASGSCSNTFQQAVADVLAKGKVIVAAAGNDGAIGISQPANCAGVLAVTAHAIDGDNANYANIGTVTAISAPGGGCGTLASSCVPNSSENGLGVISTYKGEGPYAYKYGTSMAAPHVSGVVAMMLQVHRDKYPSSGELAPAEVKSHLQSSAAIHADGTLCRQSRYLGLCGEGMVDADIAVQKVFDAAPTLSLDNAYQVVSPGTPVTLSGQGQTDSNHLWMWSQSYGSEVGLSGTTANTGVVTAYFTAPASGIYTFQLDVTRGAYSGKATATVRVNTAPMLTTLSSKSVVAGESILFNVGASDSDGDPFTFHAVGLPVGASLSANGGFYWSSAMPVGTHTLSYYAMDDAGTKSSVGTVEIVVNSGGGGSGGGGGSMDWASLLVLSLLTVGWRWHRAAAATNQQH